MKKNYWVILLMLIPSLLFGILRITKKSNTGVEACYRGIDNLINKYETEAKKIKLNILI